MQRKLHVELGQMLKPIERYLAQVDKEIKKMLSTGIPVLDDSAYHLFESGGKKIRASLIILSSGLLREPPEDVIEIAAAAEVIHCASLIHDDIIDKTEFRRGVPSVYKKWGSKVAVLTGDFMYTKALEVGVREEKMRLFPVLVAATRDMVKGELYQLEYSDVTRITKQHYFNIIELKTARFLAACMKLGAYKGGMPDRDSDLLHEAGLNLGFAFQIVDDTLDVMDQAEITGKDGGNDFLEGKVTLPLLHAMECVSPSVREELIRHAQSPDRENWKIVRQRIIDCKSPDYCIGVAASYNRRVFEILDAIPASTFRGILYDLSKFLVERNF